uniref:EGF-like domain-containing protein n=1 Tax=Mola mola TaxID=94237 RepID=A0A3Q3XDD1_MOLML
MNAGASGLTSTVLIFILNVCFYASHQLTELQICELCNGTVLNGTEVGRFCLSSGGRIHGRCCLRNDNTSDTERLTGNTSTRLTHFFLLFLLYNPVLCRDLSLNNVSNISNTLFQGFVELNDLILPQVIACPGGNASWETVEVKDTTRFCKGQKNTCNQTGQLPISCPKNSNCGPFGPGFFECSCVGDYHGYKCLREGEFPAIQVFGPLGASTVVVSLLLWFTQRRHAI